MNTQNNALSTLGAKTMSSTEIAQLTGKRKSDIHQDIKTQLFIGLYELKDGGNFHHEQIQGITVVLDNRGYWSEVLLDHEHTLTLMTGYDVKARHTINKRWLELETKQPTHQLPQTFAEALRLAAQTQDELDAAKLQIEHDQEVIKTKDNLIKVSNEASVKAGEILIREFVKSQDLVDVGEKQFYTWMRSQKIIFHDRNEPYQRWVNAGYFTYKPGEEMHGGKFRYTMRVTPRGKVWLAAKYMAYLDTISMDVLSESTEKRNGLVLMQGGAL